MRLLTFDVYCRTRFGDRRIARRYTVKLAINVAVCVYGN